MPASGKKVAQRKVDRDSIGIEQRPRTVRDVNVEQRQAVGTQPLIRDTNGITARKPACRLNEKAKHFVAIDRHESNDGAHDSQDGQPTLTHAYRAITRAAQRGPSRGLTAPKDRGS